MRGRKVQAILFKPYTVLAELLTTVKKVLYAAGTDASLTVRATVKLAKPYLQPLDFRFD